MPTAHVNGEDLAYAESGRGPDTVFVHGIPTDYRAWDAQIGPFSNEYHTIRTAGDMTSQIGTLEAFSKAQLKTMPRTLRS